MRTNTVASTLSEGIVKVAEFYPDRGFTFQAMDGKETFYSFPQIEKKTSVYAAALQKLGLKKGERVGLVIVDPEAFVMTFLGAVRIGVIPVPLYPPLSLGELDGYMAKLRRILDTAGANYLVTSGKLKNLLWSVVEQVDSLQTLIEVEKFTKEKSTPKYPYIDPSDICFLQYTSGSTSDPKGVMVTHASLTANAKAWMNHLKIQPNDLEVSWLPLFHDMGLIGFVTSPILWGVPVVLIPTLRFLKRPTVWLETMSRLKGTLTFIPPFALPLALRRAKPRHTSKWDLSCVRMLGVGAEPVNPDAVRAFTKFFGEKCGLSESVIKPGYGMAEATLGMTLESPEFGMRTNVVDKKIFESEGIAIAAQPNAATLEHVGCGGTFAEHEVVILRPESGEKMEDGVEGEICFRGPSVTPGYYNNETATAKSFKGEWLYSGDLGYLLDGSLFVTGRLKDLIIMNGRNVHPQSVEWILYDIKGVRKGNIVAFSVPGPETELLIIAIEVKEQIENLEKQVRDLVKKEMSLPIHEIVVLKPNQLPKTSSGKLQRRKTRSLYLAETLQKNAARTKGGSADKAMLAKHVARSVWTRVKHKAKNL